MSIFEWLLKIDRKYIFLVIGILVLASFFIPFKMVIKDTVPVKNVYDSIEKMDENSCVLISFDFDPSAEPELLPMSKAIIRQCLRNKVKVVAIALWPQGVGLAENSLTTVAEEIGAKRGKDWVNLGWKVGMFQVVLAIGEDITKTFSIDNAGTPTKNMEIFEEVKNYNDIDLVITLAAGNSPDTWVTFAGTKYKAKIAAGVTAVMAADYYPYLQTKQMIGLVNGLKGAAEYETLVGKPEKAVRGMTPQSAIHIAIILFILLGNISYFLTKNKK